MWLRNKGLFYERMAERYLKQKGLRLIERNYQCRFGEVDLIMMEQESLCFIEVKYRQSQAFGGSAYSISAAKRQRIVHSALCYLSDNPGLNDHAMRFDAVLIQALPKNHTPELSWIRSAFDTSPSWAG